MSCPAIVGSHRGHEHAGIAPLRALATRLKVPAEYTVLAELACRLHLLAHTAFELRANTVLELFEKLDAFRKPGRLSQLLLVCEADKRGRLGMADTDYPQAKYLLELFHKAAKLKAQPLLDRGLSGPELGAALREARLRALATTLPDAKRILQPKVAG